MNAPATTTSGKSITPIKQFQYEVEQREASYAASLPAHIPPERFKRVVLRAVQKTPDLLFADRASLLSAAMDAANDGLLPDGREGAMVIYNTKVKQNGKDVWIKKVQWMPMVFGILKKIRNSGELKSITARLVYGGDAFRYWIDEKGEHIQYEAADEPDKTIFRRAFALAVTKDEGVYIEVMDGEDIEKVRNASKSKDRGPWADWWEEMAKKTVLRRLAKRLPMSTDLDDLMRRDDVLYDFNGAKERPKVEAPRMLNDRLNALADMRPGNEEQQVEHDRETGEIVDVDVDDDSNTTAEPETKQQQKSEPEDTSSARSGSDDSGESSPAAGKSSPSSDAPNSHADDGDDTSSNETPEQAARRKGAEARHAGMSRKAIPGDFRKEPLLTAYLDGFDLGSADDRQPGEDG